MDTTINGHRHDDKTLRDRTNGDDLARALKWALTEGIFAKVRLHGNVKWTPLALVRLALFWVWSPESSLVEAAIAAIGQVTKLFGSAAVKSYQALTGALVRYTPQLLPEVWAQMQQLMPECNEAGWRVGQWLPLGVDGSRVGVPRTRKNEERFCKPRKQRSGKSARSKKRGRHAARGLRNNKARQKSHYDPQPVGPQMWLTLVWHIGLRLPWCWKVGPSYSSERGQTQEMVQERRFPGKTLFCADAGFVGYDFWQSNLDQDHQFLIRVGSNVRLLKKLGRVRESNDIVYCWPDSAMKKKQLPLVLRLLRFHDGRGSVFLVTSITNPAELTKAQAKAIYRGRWGIELQFRALKQTYGRTKLRSRTPEHAEIELHWSLVGLALVQLMALKEQSHADEPPDKTSIAGVLRIVRAMIAEQSQESPAGETLKERLCRAKVDKYKRRGTKKSRNYPRRKEEPCAGEPKIEPATRRHKEHLKTLQRYSQAA